MVRVMPLTLATITLLEHTPARIPPAAPQRCLRVAHPLTHSLHLLDSELCNLHRYDEGEVFAHFAFARVRREVDAVKARVRDGEDRLRLLGLGEAERRALAVIRCETLCGGEGGGGVERVALEERMKPRGGRTKRRIHEIQTDLEAANRDARRAGGKLQQARLLLLRHLLHG